MMFVGYIWFSIFAGSTACAEFGLCHELVDYLHCQFFIPKTRIWCELLKCWQQDLTLSFAFTGAMFVLCNPFLITQFYVFFPAVLFLFGSSAKCLASLVYN